MEGNGLKLEKLLLQAVLERDGNPKVTLKYRQPQVKVLISHQFVCPLYVENTMGMMITLGPT